VFQNDDAEMKMPASGTAVPRRTRRTVQDVVWDPPRVEVRSVLRLR
jgi:hypothetical protein